MSRRAAVGTVPAVAPITRPHDERPPSPQFVPSHVLSRPDRCHPIEQRDLPVKPRRLPEEAGIFIVLLAVIAVLSILSPSFRTLDNGLVLLVNGTVIAFLALGQTFVLLTGGIDLSTGANVAMTGVIAAMFTQTGLPWPVAAALAVGVGVVLGVVNGLLVQYLRIPAFIVTFSTQGVALAIPLILTGANSVPVKDPGFSWIGQGLIAGIPIPVVLLVIAAVVGALFLRLTRPGVHIYAMGGNKAAARLAGVNVTRSTVLVYAVSGFCGGMGGIIATSRLMVGFPSTGTGNELFYSIAAAVVGGISLFGGVGTVLGAMIGAVLIAVVSNGMNVLNVQSYWQSLVIGLIILAGVSFDTYRRIRESKTKNRRPDAPAGPITTAVRTFRDEGGSRGSSGSVAQRNIPGQPDRAAPSAPPSNA
jgi:ribose transport system permease protein